jgi:hypothetical protein
LILTLTGEKGIGGKEARELDKTPVDAYSCFSLGALIVLQALLGRGFFGCKKTIDHLLKEERGRIEDAFFRFNGCGFPTGMSDAGLRKEDRTPRIEKAGSGSANGPARPWHG